MNQLASPLAQALLSKSMALAIQLQTGCATSAKLNVVRNSHKPI